MDEVFICYRQCTVMCTMGLHLSRFIGMMFENRRFERLLKPVTAVLVYLQCIFRESLLFFCHAPEKWGVRYPPLQKVGVGGTRTPRTPRKLRLCRSCSASNTSLLTFKKYLKTYLLSLSFRARFDCVKRPGSSLGRL